MPRKLRAFEPGGIYHVTSRGSNREPIYFDDHDRLAQLAMLGRVASRHRWVVLAYCLMTNHYHQVVQVPFGGLSEGMKLLNGGYSRCTNRRHGRDAHLFENRFDATPIESDGHLLLACRYVVLNPVRAGLKATPGEWPWSSYRACVGLEYAPSFLAEQTLLRLFGRRPKAAREAYRRFVREGHDPPGHVPVSDTGTDTGTGP